MLEKVKREKEKFAWQVQWKTIRLEQVKHEKEALVQQVQSKTIKLVNNW
jgi:hypothetical protein